MDVAGGRAVLVVGFLMGAILAGSAPVQAASPAAQPHTATDGGVSPPQSLTVAPLDGTAVTPPATERENNSSVRHERRDDLGAQGDRAALQRWFATSLAANLEESMVTLDQGEYELAKSLLGESYREQLGKYVEVAGETDDESDDRAGDAFTAARDQQDEFVSAVQQYRDTYREYEAAKRAGNETRARELARELIALEAQIQRTGTNLTASYATISTEMEANLSQANQTVTAIMANISAQELEVRQESFTNTTLTIQHWTATASFRDPLQVQGQLTAANGTALADRRIVFTIGDRTVRTRTNATGRFRVTLRPTLLRAGTHTASLRFAPQQTSRYLGSTTTVPITITQTQPTVTLTQTPSTVAFDDTVTVHGRVHVASVNASGVPVQVAIGDTVLGTTRTAANGTFTFTTTLPADVPPGEHAVQVSLPLDGQALAAATTTAPLTVTSTATQLTVQQTTTSADASTVALHGTLTTADGMVIADDPVQIRVDGETLATTTTNTTGQYTVQLRGGALASVLEANTTTLNVTAVYPGHGNLESTRAHTRVEVSQSARDAALAAQTTDDASAADVTSQLQRSPWLILAGLVGGGLLCGGLWWLWRWRDRQHAPPETPTPAATPPDPTAEDTAPAEPEPPATADHDQAPAQPQVHPLVEPAVQQLEAGQTDAAVETAYAAVRQHTVDVLALDAPTAATQTYWEFYYACADHADLSDTQCTALKQLTDHYERAQFTATPVADEQATAAIATATDVLTTLDDPPAAEHPADPLAASPS